MLALMWLNHSPWGNDINITGSRDKYSTVAIGNKITMRVRRNYCFIGYESMGWT